jgi:hypothetical protein
MLSRRQRIERPSLGLIRDLMLSGSFRFDHLAFTLSLFFFPTECPFRTVFPW